MLKCQFHDLIETLLIPQSGRGKRLQLAMPFLAGVSTVTAISAMAGISTAVGLFGGDRQAFAGEPVVFAVDEELGLPFRVLSTMDSTSAGWDASATAMLDDLVSRGDFASALRSCEAMSKNSQGMAKGVALRHAVLRLFAPESETELDSVLDLLNTACAAGSRLEGKELGGGTLRNYLESTPISFDESLNQFSRMALENEELAVGNLLLISALLKLDAQEARARVFAKEAFDRASETGELNWNSLMVVLHRS
ncbi:hypothetical protein SH467x_000846 [Pirellulaceae bacterium SH467]